MGKVQENSRMEVKTTRLGMLTSLLVFESEMPEEMVIVGGYVLK